MRLEPSETELVGKWELQGGRITGDAAEKRISWLVMNSLKRIAFTQGGYEILYQDPTDGRYWELTFPTPRGHGTGPQKLSLLTRRAALEKYNLNERQPRQNG